MSHHDFDKNYNRGYQQGLESGGFNPFSPLIIGALAVLFALGAFLVFSETTGDQQQAEFNTSPPATTTPAPAPDRGPSVIPSTPATPPASPPAQ